MDADRWLDDGWFYQFVELGAWEPPPYGELDVYQRTIAEFAQLGSFFLEWRVETDAPGDDIDGGPVVMSAWGNGSALYHFAITRSLVRFSLDNPTQLTMFVDVQPDVPHTYRVEVIDAVNYSWYIDGELINSGTSIGPYPTASSRINWSAQYYLTEHTAKWGYVRYGTIPADASGDFDTDGIVNETDVYFFVDCLLGPDYDAAGPGCQWADLNADGTADGKDIPLFVDAMLDS